VILPFCSDLMNVSTYIQHGWHLIEVFAFISG
jgi:hypothetical protein